LSEIQAMQALVNQLVPGQRPAGSGPMSDKDVQLFKESLVSVINQPGGNAIIVDTLKRINEYDLEGAKIVQQVRDGTLSRAAGFAALQSRPNPLAGQMLPAGTQTQGGSFGLSPEGQAAFDKYAQ
jgi:flagellar protein FlgJ